MPTNPVGTPSRATCIERASVPVGRGSASICTGMFAFSAQVTKRSKTATADVFLLPYLIEKNEAKIVPKNCCV